MKKKILFALVCFTMSMALIACTGGEAAVMEETDTAEEAVSEEVVSDEAASDEETLEEVSSEEALDTEATDQEEMAVSVEITTETKEGASDPADEDHNYHYSIEKPVVTITANTNAQEKIQGEIDNVVDDFISQATDGNFGMIYGDPEGSYMNLSYNVLRADDKIISIAFSNEGYDQGAHGWVIIFYRNFYTSTGEQVTFDSIGADFRAKSFELVDEKRKAMDDGSDGYSIFFDECEKYYPYVVCDGTELRSEVSEQIYGESYTEEGDTSTLEPMFGIKETGFVFTSGQYALQPYAAGIIDFEIEAFEYGDVISGDLF